MISLNSPTLLALNQSCEVKTERQINSHIDFSGVAESGDDFTKFSTISQWFQTLIHPALMQGRISLCIYKFC